MAMIDAVERTREGSVTSVEGNDTIISVGRSGDRASIKCDARDAEVFTRRHGIHDQPATTSARYVILNNRDIVDCRISCACSIDGRFALYCDAFGDVYPGRPAEGALRQRDRVAIDSLRIVDGLDVLA